MYPRLPDRPAKRTRFFFAGLFANPCKLKKLAARAAQLSPPVAMCDKAAYNYKYPHKF